MTRRARSSADGPADLVRFIKSAQRSGLRLRDIDELLVIMDAGNCPCGHTADLVEKRLAEVDAEITRLEALRSSLVQQRVSGLAGRGLVLSSHVPQERR